MKKKEGKIKVVFGLNDFLVGGIQKQCVDQLRLINRETFECVIITIFDFGNEPNLYEEIPDWVRVYRLSFSGLRNFRQWYALWKILRKEKPDVVLSSIFTSNTIFRVLKPFLGYISIVSEQNTYESKSLISRIADFLLSFLSYRIIASSRSVADFLNKKEWIPKKKIEVIYNGVDVEAIEEVCRALPSKDELKKNFGFTTNEKIIVNVARLTPQKNHTLLLESFAEFYKKHAEYRLLIVGYGKDKEKLENLSSLLGMDECVKFVGIQKNVIPFYKMAEFFVLTSKIEGFALVGIEAMACGLPIVSTRTAGPDEYVKEGVNGFFVNKYEVNSVVESLDLALACEYAILSKNAQESAKHFNIIYNVKKYEKLFELKN